MAGTFQKLFIVLLTVNLFVYLGINYTVSADGSSELNKQLNFHWEGDLIDTMLQGRGTLNDITENTKNNWTDYNVKINGSLMTIPDKSSGISIGTGGISFLDGLNIIYAFIRTLGNVIVAPITLFFNFRMPVFIGILFGLPYVILLMTTLIMGGIGGRDP